MKKIYVPVLLLIISLILIACDSVNDEIEITYPQPGNQVEPRDVFTNKFGEDLIPNQWDGYGIGDPFVMRFNGVYYLFASTKDGQVGIRAWHSLDMINWTPAATEGLPEGYVTIAPETVTAYAPEVIYFDGYFYMATSPSGHGHYFLRAADPLGPYEVITDNFGESIDGSFFLDDDEQMYFLRSSHNGIRIVELDTDTFTLGAGRTLDNTIIGNWTEGPYMLKRDGIYYLTFTGNHVTSAGYRVAYSTSTTNPFDREAFTYGDNIILSTDDDFNGLGHSSTVLGPDLDSYYIAYHNLNNSGGPNRSYNLSRLLFNGTQMTVNHVALEGNFMPAGPAFYETSGDALSGDGDFLLTNVNHLDTFSAEMNFIGEGYAIFGYQDAQNYHAVLLEDQTLEVIEVRNGVATELESVPFSKTYDMTKLHTIRLAYRNEKLDVYFDNMKRIDGLEVTIAEGKLGYLDVLSTDIYATVFSDVAKGLSDQLEIKQSVVGASLYVDSQTNLSANSQLIEQTAGFDFENNGQAGALDLKLGTIGDYAGYLVDVPTEGFYGLSITVPQSTLGKTIGIQVNDATPFKVTVPNIDSSFDYVTIRLTEFDLPEGIHYLKFHHVGDDVWFNSFELFTSSKTNPSFEHDLSDYVLTGAQYINSWRLLDGGHYALEGNRQLMYFGDELFTDLTISVEMKFIGNTQAATAGLILRAANPAFSVHDSYESIQGYYVGLNNHKVFISRYNYNLSEYDLEADALSFESDRFYDLRVVLRGNHISVYIDDILLLEYVDANARHYGRIGFYTEGAATVYRNLKISA